MAWRKVLSICLTVLLMTTNEIEDAFGEEGTASSRSALLSFTYQPYDWSDKAFDDTYSFIAENSDMIFHYFDDGVPWVEALSGSKYHANVESELNKRIKHVGSNQKVAVGVNFLGKDRRALASYWGKEDGLERPEEWAARGISDPDVIAAYTKYCRSMIKHFDPDYFIYGMEVDSFELDVESKDFRDLETFISSLHKTLRKEFPELPLVLTFTLLPEEDMHKRKIMVQRLLSYTDIYAVSIYPYLFDGIGGDSEKIPENLLSRVRSYIGKKPFAVAETGFNAKTWRVLSKFIWVPGSEESQANYVKFLLSESNKLNAQFVNWWVPRDLDALWQKMKDAGADPMMSQWNSNGLVDSDGNPRHGLSIWKNWLNKPLRNR